MEPVVDECVSDVINLISSGSTLCGNGVLDGDEQCDLSLLKSPSGLSIRGSGQPIAPVSATTEGDDATIAARRDVP